MDHAPIIHDFLCYNIGMGRNYSDLLEKSVDALRLETLHLLAYQTSLLRMPLYLVGGVVRDVLMGGAVKDFDLVVEGDATALAEFVLKKYGGRTVSHSRFGTATWVLNESTFKRLDFPGFQFPDSAVSFDFVSARSETYASPGALPTVKKSTIDDDLRRRDFTINAMALRLDGEHFGELFDPLDGQKDLENRLIRVLHTKSFVDDPTRILRAFRYAGRYGFEIEPETLGLIDDEARRILSQLSGERLRHEFDLILEERNPSVMLGRLAELDLLKPVHPALTFDEPARLRLANIHVFRDLQRISPWDADKSLGDKHALGWLLWLMSLSHERIASLNLRLQFTADLLGSLFAASSIFAEISSFAGLKPSRCVERLGLYPLNAIEAVYFVARDEKTKDVFFKYLSEWRHVKPRATGDHLKERGLEPGPRYGEILRRLRAAWLDGEVKTEEAEKALLDRLLNTIETDKTHMRK